MPNSLSQPEIVVLTGTMASAGRGEGTAYDAPVRLRPLTRWVVKSSERGLLVMRERTRPRRS